MSTPAALKESGQHQAESAANPRVIAQIDRVIAAYAASGLRFSANDCRDALPTVSSRGLIGSRVDSARKRGELQAVGFTRSTLPSTRSAWIKVWVGKN